jgi:hypothetical protein
MKRKTESNLALNTLLALAAASALLAAGCAAHRAHQEAHRHGPNCGHLAVLHDGHVDYLHDGHLHHVHGGHADEHRLPVSAENPAACTPSHQCPAHAAGHVHGPKCGHEAVPHGDHTDYLAGGHLHHPHGGHCDDHGAVRLVGK